MINNLSLFLKEANSLLSSLSEYREVTNELGRIDLSPSEPEKLSVSVDLVEKVLDRREAIRLIAEEARLGMTSALESQNEEDATLIRGFFNGGEEVVVSLSGDNKLAKDVIFKLLAVQNDIIEKDTQFIAKLRGRYEEIKEAMSKLQGEKKKLDFLQQAAFAGQEKGFKA